MGTCFCSTDVDLTPKPSMEFSYCGSTTNGNVRMEFHTLFLQLRGLSTGRLGLGLNGQQLLPQFLQRFAPLFASLIKPVAEVA